MLGMYDVEFLKRLMDFRSKGLSVGGSNAYFTTAGEFIDSQLSNGFSIRFILASKILWMENFLIICFPSVIFNDGTARVVSKSTRSSDVGLCITRNSELEPCFCPQIVGRRVYP
jgi:hypothetical protein